MLHSAAVDLSICPVLLGSINPIWNVAETSDLVKIDLFSHVYQYVTDVPIFEAEMLKVRGQEDGPIEI